MCSSSCRSYTTNPSNVQAHNRTHLLELVTVLGSDAAMNNDHTKHKAYASINEVQIIRQAVKF